MTAPRELLVRLLDYIKEQAKDINPQVPRVQACIASRFRQYNA